VVTVEDVLVLTVVEGQNYLEVGLIDSLLVEDVLEGIVVL
jgi:hypothetical protein